MPLESNIYRGMLMIVGGGVVPDFFNTFGPFY